MWVYDIPTENGGFNASYLANNRMFGYAYDASGNLLSNGLYNVMTYDAEDRISSVAGATYLYDAEGNRVEKQGVGVTDTVYFGGRPIARLAAGQWTDLIYGPTGLLAEVPGTPTGSPVYRVTDHLGSTVGSLLADGTFVNPTDYTPFGQVFHGSTNDPYLFTGYERDAESGMDYASARHYASNMGRFVSPDPSGLQYATLANPQSFNLYAYVQNNPLRNTDPTGLTTDCGDQTTSARSDGGVDVMGNCTWWDDGLDRLEQTNHDIALQLAQKQQQDAEAAAAAPSKSGCTAQRIYSGLMGAANLGLAVGKGFALGGAVAGIGATGVGAPAAAVLGVYGVVSIFGQGLAGTAQLYSAVTGNYGAPAKVAQVGNILAGPVFGLGTLLRGGSMASAETNAGYESLATAASSVIDAINAGGKGLMSGMSDYHAGAVGYIGGNGSAFCGGH